MPDEPRLRAAKIDVERTAGLTVVFEDGHECFFANQMLRENCPCATCRGLRDQGQPSWPVPGRPAPVGPPQIVDAELVGGWGINLTWDDTHATGIFPWAGLREWCDPLE